MEVAVDRVLRGLEARESFSVFGDYDVDGTNGAAMLYLFLKELGATVQFYVPDRIKEGYGISHSGIDYAVEHGVNIFIAIDCGITAVEQVSYANERGLDVIICDHHEAGDVLPNAIAVLDPIKPGDTYPFKPLSGCGVGLKFIQGVARRLGKEEHDPGLPGFRHPRQHSRYRSARGREPDPGEARTAGHQHGTAAGDQSAH